MSMEVSEADLGRASRMAAEVYLVRVRVRVRARARVRVRVRARFRARARARAEPRGWRPRCTR